MTSIRTYAHRIRSAWPYITGRQSAIFFDPDYHLEYTVVAGGAGGFRADADTVIGGGGFGVHTGGTEHTWTQVELFADERPEDDTGTTL